MPYAVCALIPFISCTTPAFVMQLKKSEPKAHDRVQAKIRTTARDEIIKAKVLREEYSRVIFQRPSSQRRPARPPLLSLIFALTLLVSSTNPRKSSLSLTVSRFSVSSVNQKDTDTKTKKESKRPSTRRRFSFPRLGVSLSFLVAPSVGRWSSEEDVVGLSPFYGDFVVGETAVFVSRM